ncbi:MAG: single-stranded-DNA-specific exonuclease RecJ [Eubacterium sp.]|nr:single-stranded-DNA-specific exonuclease RecJ [Eubacterium sp.]
MKKWSLNNENLAHVSSLCDETRLSRLVCTTLIGRGILNKKDADLFLPEQPLSDPYLIKDMDKAVEIIETSLEIGEKIMIFGDYDCDGVASTVMLFNYLSALGGEVDWYIPSRNDGYGMSEASVRELAKKEIGLIITVDNGISAYTEIELAKKLGMKVIITDHHKMPEKLPSADAVINPHRADDESNFKELAGCGVVLKLIMALEHENEQAFEQFADFAAIGTVADIVPLCSENRTIVKQGISSINDTDNIGLRMLLKASGAAGRQISSTSLAFTLAPRINVAGRLDHAEKSVDLFLSESYGPAESKAILLCELNEKRQKIENDIVVAAENYLSVNSESFFERILIVSGKGWHPGVIGIVSSRLLQKYDKPSVVISVDGEIARGSARSIDGFSIYDALKSCAKLLTKFGGHTKAAGFTMSSSDLPEFCKLLYAYAKNNFCEMPKIPLFIDKELSPEDINICAISELSLLEPYGEGNPQPLFLMKKCLIISKKPLKEGKFLSFTVSFSGTNQVILNFKTSYNEFWYEEGDMVDIVVSLGINEYNGAKNIQILAKDVRRHGFLQEQFFAASDTFEKFRRGEEIDQRLYKRIMPELKHIKAVYDMLKTNSIIMATADLALKMGINYCMFSIILDVLSELNLIKCDRLNNSAEVLPSSGKADLSKSKWIARLKEQCAGRLAVN